MDPTFGPALREWRAKRRMSQLDLGLSANVSARHISFLETGRAKPSRSMVAMLCESLDVPRAARNTVLNAAGFAPAYRRRDLDSADMAPVRAAVEWVLERHNPFPAMALDRHWTLVKANAASAMLLGAVGLSEGDSLLDAMVDTDRMKPAFENWPEVAHHIVVRLRTESAHLGGDPILDDAARARGDTGRGDARHNWRSPGIYSGAVSRERHGTVVFLDIGPVRVGGRYCSRRAKDRDDVSG